MFAEFGAMTASCIEGHKDRDSCVKSCDLQLRGLGGQKFLPTFTFFLGAEIIFSVWLTDISWNERFSGTIQIPVFNLNQSM